MTVRRWNSSWKEGSTGRRRLIGAKIPQKSVANPRCGIHLVNPRSSQSPSNWPECVFLENVVFFEIGRSGGFQESELRARRGGANAAQFSWTPSQDNSLAKQSFQEIFSSLILKMSGLTLRGRRVWTFTLSEIKGGEAGKPFEIYIYLFGIKEPSPF